MSPIEVRIWGQMSPVQRLSVIQQVPSTGSLIRRHRGCMKHIRSNLALYIGFLPTEYR